MTRKEQKIVLVLKAIFTFDLFYHLLYTIVTAMTLYNKLFAAVLLLDVLVHIPALRTISLYLGTLLESIWQPRYQVILTVITFIII